MEVLGIDIGGSGIKGAPVDLSRGTLSRERRRIGTPHPAVPEAVADVVMDVVEHFEWDGLVGCTFPAVVKGGVTLTAANVDPSWVRTNAQALFERRTGRKFVLMNDADAAGIAEMAFGAGQGRGGVVVMLTLGTGIGSALFIDGKLVPNTEFGHLEIEGKDAESRASARVRTERGLSWKAWAKRLNSYLERVDALLSPDLVIVGGGVSEESEKFVPRLNCEVVPAQLGNDAGIVGAALQASRS